MLAGAGFKSGPNWSRVWWAKCLLVRNTKWKITQRYKAHSLNTSSPYLYIDYILITPLQTMIYINWSWSIEYRLWAILLIIFFMHIKCTFAKICIDYTRFFLYFSFPKIHFVCNEISCCRLYTVDLDLFLTENFHKFYLSFCHIRISYFLAVK